MGFICLAFACRPAWCANSTQCVWVAGDSLAAGLAPQVSSVNPDKVVTNAGLGGQSARSIAPRLGASDIWLDITGPEESVPGAWKVRNVDPDLLSFSGNETQIGGQIAGRPAVLRWRRGTGYVLHGTYGNIGLSAGLWRFDVDLAGAAGCTLVLWAGRNGAADFGGSTQAIARILTIWKARYGMAYVLSIPVGAGESLGTPAHNQIDRLNAWLAGTYPTSYIDVGTLLGASAEMILGTPLPPEDVQDLANGIVPRGLRLDNIHLTVAANRALAEALAIKLKAVQ